MVLFGVGIALLIAATALRAQSLITADAVVTGLATPVAITHAGDQRLFITEQTGRIRIVDLSTNPPTLIGPAFLDIHTIVRSPANGGGGEEGLLSVAFDPHYKDPNNGFFYVYYTANTNDPNNTYVVGDNVVACYTVSGDPNIANSSGTVVLPIAHPTNANHNGGQLQFGKDGFLYIGTGDGGSGNDPPNNAQNKGKLLGKILRLRMNGPAAYSIPPGNPFANDNDANTLAEIWHYGLRNPFRFTVDRQTGDLFIGDVGQSAREEVDFAPAGVGGLNFGWRVMEGTLCNPNVLPAGNPPCNDPSFTPPILEYPNPSEGQAVISGPRYRGTRLIAPGTYLFSDFYKGIIQRGIQDAQGNWSRSPLLSTGFNVSAFGEDPSGEVYVTNYAGTLYKLNPTDTDADGLPNWWEAQYFNGSTTAAVASDDSDGDGLTNAQEFVSGTNPQSGASALRVTNMATASGAIEIQFASVFGKSYQLEYKDNITDASWNSLGAPITGTGGVVPVSDSVGTNAHRVYRLRLL